MRHFPASTLSETTLQVTRFPYPLRAEPLPLTPMGALPAIPAHPAFPRSRQRHGKTAQNCFPQLSYPAARAFFHAGGTLCPSQRPQSGISRQAGALTDRIADFIGAVVMFGGFYGLLLVT